MTPLMWAAWKGKAPVVELLASSSAKLDRQEKWGRTALILAADEGHADVVCGIPHVHSFFPLAIIFYPKFVVIAIVTLILNNRFACFCMPVRKLTRLQCEQFTPLVSPHSRARCSVPGDEKMRSVAASTASKNKFAWYGKSALQIAQQKGHLNVVALLSATSDTASFGENL